MTYLQPRKGHSWCLDMGFAQKCGPVVESMSCEGHLVLVLGDEVIGECVDNHQNEFCAFFRRDLPFLTDFGLILANMNTLSKD